jgi:DNA-binding transcriptional ArsR family regulator
VTASVIAVPAEPDEPDAFVSSNRDAPWTKETKPLRFLSIRDVLSAAPGEPDWLWDGYLAPGTVTALAGRPKVGKSTQMFALVSAITSGATFLDRSTRKTGVLILSEEREDTLSEKARRFSLGDGVQVLMRHQAQRMTWPQIVEESLGHCRELDLGLLVVDTWDKWTGLRGDSENSAGAVLEALEPIMHAAGERLAVLILAHQRKSRGEFGEAVRGSNALTGSVDIIVELERPPAAIMGGETMRVLRALSRYGATPDELVCSLTEAGYVAHGGTLEVRHEAEREQVRDAVEAAQEATADEIGVAIEMPKGSVMRHLEELERTGFVHRGGRGVRGDPFRWMPGPAVRDAGTAQLFGEDER